MSDYYYDIRSMCYHFDDGSIITKEEFDEGNYKNPIKVRNLKPEGSYGLRHKGTCVNCGAPKATLICDYCKS